MGGIGRHRHYCLHSGLCLDAPRARAEGLKLRPASHDGQPKQLAGTDGSRLYFNLQNPTSPAIVQVAVAGGASARIAAPSPAMALLSDSPDGSDLLATEVKVTAFDAPLWSLPVLGGSPRRLGDIVASGAAWFPDGKTLAYTSGGDLFSANHDGTEPLKLTSVPGLEFAPVWSPDGSKLRLNVQDPRTRVLSLWEVSAQGKNLRFAHRLA